MTEEMVARTWRRSQHDRMLAGVCGGLADYMGAPSTLVRLLWVCFVFASGVGVVAYITAMILIPSDPAAPQTASSSVVRMSRSGVNQSLFWGILLVVSGAVLFLDQMDIIGLRHVWHHWPGDMLWPAVLILTGLMLILGAFRQNTMEDRLRNAGDFSGFRRRSTGKKIWGVCGGLAETTGIDVNAIRVVWVVLTFASFPVGVFLYLVIGLLTGDEEGRRIFGHSATSKPM